MRDPNRLYSLYDRLRTVHMEQFPDWRFGQFIFNFLDWYKKDPFYIEDDKFLELLDRFVNGESPE